MARSAINKKIDFESWQVWPGSYRNPPTDGTYPSPGNLGLKIDRSTPIASMGSCFARNIRNALLQKEYNYITEEAYNPASVHASAAWERVYNTFSMRQIFEYTFEEFNPELRWWMCPDSKLVQEPYRRIIFYDSIAEAEADFERHRTHSRRALKQAEVFILTLGLTEIWEDKKDGSVICLPSGPYVKEGGDMSRYRFRVSRYNENLENLERIYAIMAKHNPNCQILVTVSPVHLFATFRKDADVITASCNSKSTLRSVTDEFASRYENVFYFPAFEMATIYRPMVEQPIFSKGKENFHVNEETINFIMSQFFEIYCL